MSTILENALVEKLAGGFPRSPLQLNRLRESDAELVRLPGADTVLAVTTDGIVEEIESGLYADPYLIGWMSVMVNASDLAAVGAEPLGIVLDQTLPHDLAPEFLQRLQLGVRDACTCCDLHVLGGDTNFSTRLAMGATALGVVPDGVPLTRRGCSPGDRLYASAGLGLGGAFALARLGPQLPTGGPDLRFLPRARVDEGQLLRPFASSCMDTSDGVVSTLDELMRINGVGFRISGAPETLLHPQAAAICGLTGITPWMLLSAPHGEFELLFTVPPDSVGRFLDTAAAQGWDPLPIGEAMEMPVLEVCTGRGHTVLDTAAVRNLFLEVDGDVDRYIEELTRLVVV